MRLKHESSHIPNIILAIKLGIFIVVIAIVRKSNKRWQFMKFLIFESPSWVVISTTRFMDQSDMKRKRKYLNTKSLSNIDSLRKKIIQMLESRTKMLPNFSKNYTCHDGEMRDQGNAFHRIDAFLLSPLTTSDFDVGTHFSPTYQHFNE